MDLIPQIIFNSIIAGSFYCLLAFGFNLIFRTAKFFDLSYGAITAIGGYAAFWFIRQTPVGPIWATVLGVIFSGLIGMLFYKLIYGRLRKQKASNMVLLVASLGVFTIAQALLAIGFTSQFQTLNDSVLKTFTTFGATITTVQLITLGFVAVITVVLALIFKTMFGKSVVAIGDNEEVAKIVGINTERVTLKVFFIASAIGGLAGILTGFDTGIQPTMGLSLLLKGVIAAIIGGVGNVYGSIAGGFLLGFVENFGILKISGEWKDAIAFGLLIVFLVFRPQGIFKK